MALGGGGVFDVFSTTASQAAGLTGNPQWGASTLMVDPAVRAAAGISGTPGIVADGISISVDRELLIDAVDGAVQVQDSILAVQPWQGQGGSLSLLGSDVLVEGASQLLATGPSGGGLIQIGGSWQNSNPQVRQAIRTAFGREALADASATDRGHGGTVVVWSDVLNPYSVTTAKGVLKAEAGTQGGDGGQIETSGHKLDVSEAKVQAKGFLGKPGHWLLDPVDIIIASQGGTLSSSQLTAALSSQDVTLDTTSAGSCAGVSCAAASTRPSGSIANNDTSSPVFIGAGRTLTLISASANCSTCGLTGSGGFSLGTSTSSLVVTQSGNTTYAGVVSGNGRFVKTGVGALSLAAANTFTGSVYVGDGALSLAANGSLADSVPLVLASAGSFGIQASEVIGSLAGSGSVSVPAGAILSVGSDNSTTTFSGVISGGGGITKLGVGAFVLTGNNTYFGPTRVEGGTLNVLGAAPTTATCAGGSSNICQVPSSRFALMEGGDEGDEADAADPVDAVDPVDEADAADEADVADAADEADVADEVDAADASDLSGVFTEDEIREVESILSSVLTGADETPLLAAGPVEFDSFSALTDAFTGADIDGDTGFSSSPTSEPEAAAGLDSLEGAMALSDSAGETMLSARGVTVDVSMGSSFTVEAQGSAESVESSTPASSSNGGSATSTSGSSAGTDAGSTVSSSAPAAATPGGAPVASVPAQQAVAGLNQADQAQSQALVNSVLPERSGSAITAPSVTQMQSGLSKAAASIRAGVGLGADSAGGLGPQSWLPRGLLLGSEADQLMASANTLIAASDVGGAAVLPPSFNRAAYNPAILHVRFTQARDKVSSSSNDAFLDITLIPLDGEPEGRRVELSQQAFANDLRTLYRQLSRQESLQVDDPKSPSRRLYDQLFAVITPVLQQRGITTLLISADRGLQAVPFAALHNGERYFGDRYAFSLTPSLALTNLSPPTTGGGRLLAAGASEFVGLAPLPLVPTELTMMSTATIKDTALNQQFTPSTLLEQAADPRYNRVHVATHAEFLPGGPAKSKLYSGTVPIALSDFVKLRLARRDAPLDLISFSACRTALGDAESERGFAGLALQAGARSAVGTLWYVDDVATSAYFVQLYRYLDAGVPKAEALQLTRQAFARGLVRLQGDQMVGPDGAVLSTGLTTAQQRRAAGGLSNPYFWAGIELLGSPW